MKPKFSDLNWVIPSSKTLTLFAVFTSSLIVRFLYYDQVFTDYGFFPPSDDPPYHLRRILYIIQNYPYVSYFDPALNFPEGAYVIWHYGFDLALAAVSFVLSGFAPSEESVIFISSITIPVLGALTAIPVFLIAEKIAGRFAGILAAFLFALLPAHSDYSFVGRVDHHVMEPLLIAAAVLLLIGRKRKRPGAILTGSLLGGANFFFPAAIYFLLIFYAANGVSLLFHRKGDLKETAIPLLAAVLAAVCAAVMTSPFRTSFVFYSPSLMHIAVAFFALAFAIVLYFLRYSGIRQLVIASGCVAALAATTFFAAPEFPASILDGLKYSMGNPMTELSFETQSSLSDPQRLLKLAGGAVFLLPVGLILFFWRCIKERKGDSWRSNFFLVLFVSLLALSATFQRRFLVVLSPFIAVFAAVVAIHLKDAIERIWVRKWIAHTAAAALLFAIQAPALSRVFSMKVHTPQDTVVFKSLEWLKEYDQNQKRPGERDFSVVAPWHYGHLITYMTGMPNVANNFFGIPVHDKGIADGIRFFFALNKEEVKEIIRNRKIRYIFMVPVPKQILRTYLRIAGLDAADYFTEKGELKVEYTQTMEYQLGVLNGAKIPFVKLIYEDKALDNSGKPAAHVKIFEVN